MDQQAAKADLQRSLDAARDALIWKADGLAEYDLRRPLTPTGTNLLGIVKHVASVENGYLGDVFGRPSGEPLPWLGPEADPNADMWATAEESSTEIFDLYARTRLHGDATIESLDLGSGGEVPWWPEDRRGVTLHEILVHLIAETHRHAGHADILRELIDGAAGHRAEFSNLPDLDEQRWASQHRQIREAAESFRH